MTPAISKDETFGLIRPDIDAHTLGISAVGKLIEDCGFRVVIGDATIARAVGAIRELDNITLLGSWIRQNRISRLGFSYRLDPEAARLSFGKVYHLLTEFRHFQAQGGTIRHVYFSGLPESCAQILAEYKGRVTVFEGDETQRETALKLGIPESAIPTRIAAGSAYDALRNEFAQRLVEKGQYRFRGPRTGLDYPARGTRGDSLALRIRHVQRRDSLPLMRAHVGPYLADYAEAKKQFLEWSRQLARAGYLDVLSIGSSQLSQSNFGEEWGAKPNGGGVPINSEQDLADIYEASRPMLVRTYAGTQRIPQLAGVYERTINIAWHALSFWWFNQMDGRGPLSVRENLEQHVETLAVIAKSGKPFEPNIPHHFSFRGADDVSYVLSSYLAAKAAKAVGVKYFVLQVMFNTPKYTWGVQDLAKARAMLKLVRGLEDENFKVFLQPRAGLDYFSPDLQKARIQLAAVTAMMDDIEPDNPNSPDIVHVVSYCEAVTLATPDYINESIQIVSEALCEYRRDKKRGAIDIGRFEEEISQRTEYLLREASAIVALIEKNIKHPYAAEGLYRIFQLGIMPVPYLWECREEFSEAVKWSTALVDGGVHVVDRDGRIIPPAERVAEVFDSIRSK